MKYLSDEEQKEISLKAQIDVMSREEMARRWRFAPVGDPMFQGEVGDYFTERFKKLGGFSPEISKKIGW
jgi:hypothetical protein